MKCTTFNVLFSIYYIFQVFLAVECMPGLFAEMLEKGVTVPTSLDGKSTTGLGIGKDGKITVTETEHSETVSEMKDEQHQQDSYDHEAADGSDSVSSNSTHDHKHSEKKTKDETKTKKLEFDLKGGGVKSTNEKSTVTNEEVHDEKSGSSNFKKTKTGDNSGQLEESGSSYTKEEETHNKKNENEKDVTEFGLGGLRYKKEKEVKEEREEHKKETGENFTHKQGYSIDGNTTTQTEEGSGDRYSKSEDKSQKTSTHDSEVITKDNENTSGHNSVDKTIIDNAGDPEQEPKGHRHHHHHHHIPHGIYQHLNQDSRKLGLTHGSAQVISEESMENHAYPWIRHDYLLAVAHKLHNAKVTSAGRGNTRVVGSQHNSDEYRSIASPYGDLRGPQYRTLAEKLGHSPVSSHYANTKFVESKYGNMPSFYVSRGSKYRVHGTGTHGTGKSQYSTSNNQNDVGNLKLSPAEWEERAPVNTVNLNDQFNEHRNSIDGHEGISGRRYRPGYVRKPTIDPDVKKAIFSQNIRDILKNRGEHNKDTLKDVIYFLNGHGGSGKKRILAHRTKKNKIRNSHTEDIADSNFDNEITRRSHDNVVHNNARYRKIEDSYSTTKYNGIKVGSIDSYGKSREYYGSVKYNDDQEKYDGLNDKIRDSKKAATKYNDGKVEFDHSTEKTTIYNNASKYGDDKEALDDLITKYNDVQVGLGGLKNDNFTEISTENSVYTVDNNYTINNSNVDNSTRNLVHESSSNATPKVQHDKTSDSESTDNVYVNSNNLESSSSFDKLNHEAIPEPDTSNNDSLLDTKGDSYSYDTKPLNNGKSNIVNTFDHIENDSVIVNSSSYDPEIKTKSETYSQDKSDTDSVVTKSDFESIHGINEVKSTTDNIGYGIYDTYAGGPDMIAKNLTSVISIMKASGIGTDPNTSDDISEVNLNSSNFTAPKIVPESESSGTNASGNSTNTESLEVLDGGFNISDTITNATLSSGTSNLYDYISARTVISITEAYENSTDTEITDIPDGYSSGFETTTLQLDTSDKKPVIGITKASDNSTVTGANKIPDGNYNDNDTKITYETSNASELNDSSLKNKIVIDMTKSSATSNDTGNNHISDGNSNDFDTIITNEISKADEVYDSNSDITVIGIAKASDNSTDTGTTSIPDGSTNDFSTITANETDGYTSDFNSRITNETLVTDDYDISNSDETVTGIAKVSVKSSDTGTFNISDGQPNNVNSTITKETTEFNAGDIYASNTNTTMIGFINSSGNVTNIDTTDTTTASNSYDSDKTIANAGAKSDTSNYDSSSDTSVIQIAKAISNPTKTQTDAELDRSNYDSNTNTSLIRIEKLISDPTETQADAELDRSNYDSNTNTSLISIAKSISDPTETQADAELDRSNYDSNTNTSLIRIAKSISDPTETQAETPLDTGNYDSSSDTSVIRIAKSISDPTETQTETESDTGNYDSDSDTPVIRFSKAISDPTETPFTDISDGNLNISDIQNPWIATFSSGTGADNLNSESVLTKISNVPVKTDGAADPVFGTNSDDVTNITQTTIAMVELSSNANGLNDSYFEGYATSTSKEFDGSNNSTNTVEAYASSNGSDTSSQAVAKADANIDDASASLATTVANASSSSTAIDSNIPSKSNDSDKPVMDTGSSTDVSNVPITDTSGNGNSGTSDYTNTVVTSDVPTSYGSKSINTEYPTTESRTMGDKSNTKKPLTVARPKKRKLIRDAADATESRSDENDSSSFEHPILNGVDSANTYDSGSSIEE